MRNRIVGGIAFVLGLLYLIVVIMMLLNDREIIETKILIALVSFGLYFFIVGVWQLFTGKGMASMIKFIVFGKITEDNSNSKK